MPPSKRLLRLVATVGLILLMPGGAATALAEAERGAGAPFSDDRRSPSHP